jgi:hypothetical protein
MEIARFASNIAGRRSILDAPIATACLYAAVPMTSPTRALFLTLALATLAAAAACGASNQQTHDGTTVTVEKPADSSAAPPAPAATASH